MTTHEETIARPAVAAPPTKFTSGLSQSDCACGGSVGLQAECGDCAKKRAARPQNAETDHSSSDTHTVFDSLRFAGQRRLGHNFSDVQVLGAAGVVLHGDTPVEKGNPNPTPKPADAKAEEESAPATTPEGTSLGPTNRAKTFCLKADTFNVTTGIHKNSASAAQGSQIIKFEGLNTGKRDNKDCSCDCGLYRHWISGFLQAVGPDQVSRAREELVEERRKANTPGNPTAQEVLNRASANTPKVYSLKSCGHPITIQEGAFTEERISCIGDKNTDRCKWEYGDGPGADGGLRDGIYIHVNHPFQYEIWDSCQGKSVQKKQATVEIKGDTSPRSITWT
jgi:hypothetical protein